jgi:hypothetical protein
MPTLAADQEETGLLSHSFQAAGFVHFRQHSQVSDIYSMSPLGVTYIFDCWSPPLKDYNDHFISERKKSQQEKCFPCTS